MQICFVLRALEHSMLVPVGLANTKLIASFFQQLDIFIFTTGIGHRENDINDRFGWKLGNRGGPHMFYAQRALA
jgi:hypothetical protein